MTRHKTPKKHAPSGAPKPPEWLSEYQKAEFQKLVDAVDKIGTLSSVDHHIFTVCACAMYEFRTAEQYLRIDGLVVTLANGNLGVNPYAKVRDNAYRRIIRALTELGLTPKARKFLGQALEAEDGADKLAEFMASWGEEKPKMRKVE